MSRIVIWVAAIFAVLYAGYWVVGWQGALRAIPAWAEDRRTEGWQVDYSDLSVLGFPSRFDTTLSDLAVADPRTGWAWEGAFFQLLALSYRPNHLIAVLPPAHSLSTPLARYDLTQAQARASLVVTFEANPQIDRTTVVIDAPRVTTRDWTSSANALRFATRRLEDAPLTHEIGLQTQGLVPSRSIKAQLDPAGLLPPAIETLRLDAALSFDAPWDLRALEQRRPQITALDLREARASWGGMDLRLTGRLDVDSFGFASGEIDVQAQNWRAMLDVAERGGALPARLRPLLESALEGLSDLSGRAETLDLDLTIAGGRISVGFLPLGQLPPLVLR